MREFTIKVTEDGADDLKEIMTDIWDAYPRVDMLHRWSSRWKEVAEKGSYTYAVRTEYTDPEGRDIWVYVSIDGHHDVIVTLREEVL